MAVSTLKFKTVSRFFTHPQIKQPFDVATRFVYSFFVPDEAEPDSTIATDSMNDDRSMPDGSLSLERRSTKKSSKSLNFQGYLQTDDSGNSYMTDPSSGKKLILINGKLATEDTLARSVPRFVEINWQLSSEFQLIPAGTFDTLQSLFRNRKVTLEENISSVYDANIRSIDAQLQERLYRKLSLLGRADSYTDSAGSTTHSARESAKKCMRYDPGSSSSTMLSKRTGYSYTFKTIIDNLFDQNVSEDSKRVNDLGSVAVANQFTAATRFSANFQYDRRLLKNTLYNGVRTMKTEDRKRMRVHNIDDAKLPGLPAEAQHAPFLETTVDNYGTHITDILTETPFLKAETITDSQRVLNQKVSETGPGSNVMKANQFGIVGYIVDRYTHGQIENMPKASFFIDGGVSKNFIDTEVTYGQTYYYSVRAVYVREAITQTFDSDGAPLQEALIRQFFASRPSSFSRVKCTETTPPNEPDAVFFKFNYGSKRGLIINWQFPVGRSRDTRYFQIFRRKTIHEPFQCIGEIDFNNATVKTMRREKISPENVVLSKGPKTVFEDVDFTRESSFIYAICSVDAHGLTSPYSYQTRVTFNKVTNRIEMKHISRSGAPKQYPNFYVDPDEDESVSVFSLTQDVISSSGKQSVKIYLDPDCESYVRAEGDSTVKKKLLNTVSSSTGGAVYKMHFINLDRHKDDSLEIRIKDVRDEN